MTVPREGPRSGPARADPRAIGLIAITVAAYIAISWNQGALGASRNDDWTYYRSAWQFAEDGFFDPDPYTITMLVGQTVLVQPLVALAGGNLAAYQVVVAVLGGVGLCACYAVLRSFLRTSWSLLAVGCLALGPIFGSISVTFMSDVPAFSLQALCLWAGMTSVHASERARYGWLALSLALGLLAFSIREYSVAAPAAVLLLHAWNARQRPRAMAAVGTLAAIFLGLTVAMFVWRSSLGGNDAVGLRMASASDIGRVVKACFTLGFLISPAVVSATSRLPSALSRRRLPVVAAMGAVGLLGLYAWLGSGETLLRNYLTPRGSYPETLHGTGVEIVPAGLWNALNVVAIISTAVAVGLLVGFVPPRGTRLGRHTDGLAKGCSLAASFVLLAMGSAAAAHLVAAAPLFDRYLIPAVPFAAGVVLYAASVDRANRRSRPLGGVAIGLWAALGLHFVDATATYDGLKWQVGQRLEAAGYDPMTIEAGLEWFGLHQDQPLRPPEPHPGQLVFWWGLFEEPEVCVLASTVTTEGDPQKPGSTSVLDLSGQTLLGVEYRVAAYPVPEWCGDRT